MADSSIPWLQFQTGSWRAVTDLGEKSNQRPPPSMLGQIKILHFYICKISDYLTNK